ncbi:hypothetical protein LPJ61_005172 [Coemansia biformis]|uniref:Uncharacterized protein n=1 Tax=Coemansia biformis TaxID=1286918 RepID=A0A9W7Y790_9FUNG|nr:hypothetical protein LPJ61_005172 [Coemansia biformis]
MNLHDLPEDILICIIKATAHAYIHEAGRWGSSLTLLAVCRTWRQLGRPLIYGGLYVHYSDSDVGIRTTDDDVVIDGPASGRLMTNADLVAAVGAVDHVKYIDIAISCIAEPLQALGHALDVLEGVSHRWPAARKVALDIHHAEGDQGSHGIGGARCEASIQQTASRFASLLPSVRRLIFDGHPLLVTKTLYGRLASAYASQLQSLDSKLTMVLPDGQALVNLSVLSIDFGSGRSCLIPRVATDALGSLSLSGIPDYDVWLSFADGPHATEAVFANLKHLSISYGFGVFDGAESARPSHIKLAFPRLKSLTIKNVYSHCPVIAHGVFPLQLDLLDAECSSAIFGLLGRVRFRAIRKTVISAICDDATLLGVLPEISRIAAVTSSSITSKLSVISGQLDARDVNVDWRGISALHILASASFPAVLTIIARAPMLRELMVHDLMLDGTGTHDTAQPLADPQHALPPCIDVKLTHLLLSYRRHMFPVESAVAAVRYLALHMPLLKRLTAWYVPPAAISEFVEEHSVRYPHLKNIEFVFEDADWASA